MKLKKITMASFFLTVLMLNIAAPSIASANTIVYPCEDEANAYFLARLNWRQMQAAHLAATDRYRAKAAELLALKNQLSYLKHLVVSNIVNNKTNKYDPYLSKTDLDNEINAVDASIDAKIIEKDSAANDVEAAKQQEAFAFQSLDYRSKLLLACIKTFYTLN